MKKVLFVAPPYINLEANTGGVFQEMLLREQALKEVGITVEYLNLGKAPNWDEIDIVHLFMANEGSYGLALKVKEHKKLIVSPIIDRTESNIFLKVMLKVMNKIPFMYSNLNRTQQICNLADGLIARSEEEVDRIKNAFSCNNYVDVIESPIAINIDVDKKYGKREEQVLFIGDAGNPRKNVIKLIEQINKLNYKLVIAGKISVSNYGNKVKKLIENSDSVKYLGIVSNNEKFQLMSTSKVFALPSTMEGIGLSAMEAYLCKCSMCVTKNGGIPSYLKDNAFYIDPYDDNSLYEGLNKAMNSTIDNEENIFEDFTFAEIGRKMKLLYEEVLK